MVGLFQINKMGPNDFVDRVYSWFRSPKDSLNQRILHSGFWASFLNVSDRSFQIIRLIILARLLSPSDFGLLGLALLTMQILNQFTNLGIDAALIQRQDEIKSYLDTVWLLKISRGFVVFVVLIISSPIVSEFFGEPQLKWVLPALAAGVIIRSFANPAIVYFQRELEFQKQFVYQMSGTVVDFIIAIVFAIRFHSVWALVFGILGGRLTRLAISYLISDYRPALRFDRKAASDLLQFGKWMWATGLVVLIATSGDDAFVGWYLPAAALGLYQLAFRLSNTPATEVTHVISSVMFPAYSKIQDNQDRLRSSFRRTIRVVVSLTTPMALGILVIASPFTQVFLGSQWMAMVPTMQVVAIAGLVRSILATGGALFQGVGLPEWDFRMNLIRASTIILTLWPLTSRWEIAGTAVSITLGLLSTIPIWVYKSSDITGLLIKDYVYEILIPVGSSLLMAYVVSIVVEPTILRLIVSVITGIIIYFPTLYALHRAMGTRLLNV